MIDNKGNRWEENEYEGYGDFGGKDFYELVAEMNGKQTREEGLDLFFGDKPFISPNLVESPDLKWVNRSPDMCTEQGYFYESLEEEDEEEDEEVLIMSLIEKIEGLIDQSIDGLAFCDGVEIDEYLDEAIYKQKRGFAVKSSAILEDLIDSQNGFKTEIIYYAKAMEYLKEYDTSLMRSLELAEEMGLEIKDLNSEVLASLIASDDTRNEFLKQTKLFKQLDELTESYLSNLNNL